MKLRITKQKSRGLTSIDVVVVVIVLLVLGVFLYQSIQADLERHSSRLNCVSYLKMINLSLRIWEGDNNNLYPMAVSTSNGGAKELIEAGNAVSCFEVLSNEMGTAKIFVCPLDKKSTVAKDFGPGFSDKNISYFIGADATENNPPMLLDGDDNFEIGGVPAQSGILPLTTNTSIIWGSGRHVLQNSHFWTRRQNRYAGNIGLADGSVLETSTLALRNTIAQTGVTTNRIAIP